MNLSPHFSLQELTASDTAAKLNINNSPPVPVLMNLSILASGLEQIRSLLGYPIHVNSGYRCPELNKSVRGVPDSAHLSGFAADIVCPQFGTPEQIVLAIQKAGIPVDQAIQEGTWVHVSFAPTMRNQFLTAHFNSEGKANYTTGV